MTNDELKDVGLHKMSMSELIDLVKLQEAALRAEHARYESLFAAHAVPAQTGIPQPVTIPHGWDIKRHGDGDIVVQKNGLGGYSAQADADNIASSILHALASDMLAAQPVQQPAPVFAFEDDKNFLHRIDLLLDTKYPVMRKDALARRISELANEFILAAPVAAPVSAPQPVGRIWLCREDHFLYAKLDEGVAGSGAVKLGDLLYAAAPVAAPVAMPDVSVQPEIDAAHALLSKHCVADLKDGKPATLVERIEELWSWYEPHHQGEVPDSGRDAALEEVATWYKDKGWMLDEDDVPAAIRALAAHPANVAQVGELSDAVRFAWLIENKLTGSLGFGNWWIDADESKEEWRAAIDRAMSAPAKTDKGQP
jgi:hypothetical protein